MTRDVRDRPRLAFVLESDDIGGAELTFAAIAERLAPDFDVTAVLARRAHPETRRRLERAGAKLEPVRGLHRYCTPAGFARLLVRLRSIDPDLVHISCTDQGGALAPLIAGSLLGIPTVATLHLVSPGRRRWREWISARALARPDAVIAVSRSVGEYLAKHGIEAVVVLNGVEIPVQQPDPRGALGIPLNADVVGGVGRLHVQKGWDVLCRAAAIVRQRLPETQFLVVGEGPEREMLEATAACRHVRFVGAIEEAATLIRGFDVFTAPSRWEGFGRVVVEAMLSGVPVIASDVDGLPEVVGGAGLLIPPDHPEILAAAIVRLLEDRELRLVIGDRGRRRAAKRFGVDRMVSEVRDVYEDVLRHGSGAAAGPAKR